MNETTDATAILAPLWRRKWLILIVGIVVAAASYLYYKHAQPTYSASTQIFLGASSEESVPGEKVSKSSAVDVSNQATIINSIVVEEVQRQLRVAHKGGLTRGSKVKAKAAEKSELITITAEAHKPKGTELLANQVAQAYIRRRNLARQQSIEKAIAISRRQLRRIEAAEVPKSSSSAKGKGTSGAPTTASIIQTANLNSKINELESSLAVSGAQQIKPASKAQLVAPKPRKDAIFGFVIGIVLACIGAYTLSRFDRRLRTLEGIESIFQAQTLTVLPKVARPITRRAEQPSPSRLLLEPLRRLHTTLQLGVGENPVAESSHKVILFTSPDAGDGKSTLVADLALVARDAGKRMAIVEADFRRPVQTKLLALSGTHGLAEVLAGTMSIEDAVQRVLPLAEADEAEPAYEPTGAVATALATNRTGSLFLLAGSSAVANPPALLADRAMSDVLSSLRDDFDYVLIDAPSPLEVSDVMPLLKLVDGIVLLARAGHTREASAQRLMQLLAHTPTAQILGVVANCVSKADISRYGLSSATRRSWLAKLIGS